MGASWEKGPWQVNIIPVVKPGVGHVCASDGNRIALVGCTCSVLTLHIQSPAASRGVIAGGSGTEPCSFPNGNVTKWDLDLDCATTLMCG